MAACDRLAAVLSEFARTLLTDFSIENILDHLTRRIVDLLPIDAAGVSLISPTTRPYLVAGSDESAVRYERLQTSLGEGPCLVAYGTDRPVSVPDLAAEDRFPTFIELARAEGLAAVFTFPLRSDDRRLGALDLYRTTAGDLGEEDMATAQTLADVATAYLLNAEARLARTDFVATVSHELRTPMTSIAGFAELLQERGSGPLSVQERGFVDAIYRNAQRLTDLASDLLTVSSLESGERHRHDVVDLGAAVSGARESLGPAMARRSLDVTFDIPAEPVLVDGHAAHLEALLVNLVGNALKFTQDGGWVRCRLLVEAQSALLEVSDNGLGIPRAEQREIFTRFFRSSTAQERAIQGTGLGLAIVDAMVPAHGGDIAVQSDHLAGSIFTVSLPVRTEQHPEQHPEQHAEQHAVLS